jgi:hypothetical protein
MDLALGKKGIITRKSGKFSENLNDGQELYKRYSYPKIKYFRVRQKPPMILLVPVSVLIQQCCVSSTTLCDLAAINA